MNRKKEVFMKILRLLPLSFIALLLFQACSSPVYVQKDETANLNDYKTYMWVDTRRDEKDDGKSSARYADIGIRNAVNAELRQSGWREVNDNPDILIGYDVLVERAVEQQSEPVYSRPFTRMYYNPYRRRWGTIYYPSQFLGYDTYSQPVREGTVTITMIDAQNDKTVWQGWTTERLNYSRMTEDEISRSVRNIFKKFDVAMR